MKLGILTALSAEAARLPAAGTPVLGTHAFMHVVSGPGQRHAEAGARTLVAAGCEALLSFGLAGGLDVALRPGALVLAREIHAEDGARLACDAPLRDALLHALETTSPTHAALASVAAPVTEAAAKHDLYARWGCVAVDMESAAVARVAQAHGLPCAALRAVVDPADFSLPRAALAGMGEDGAARPSASALALLRRPWELPALLRLALWYGGAMRTLAAAGAALAR